jgi:hypothetical protein
MSAWTSRAVLSANPLPSPIRTSRTGDASLLIRFVVPACCRIPDMVVRLILAAFASTCLFAQCDDIELPAKKAKQFSEVVFRGTIERFGGSGDNRTVIFRVSRVWKGRVGPTFEMPAIETDGGFCNAFWRGTLVQGNELVVYSSHFPPGSNDYLPMRSKTMLVSRAKDLSQLGRGRKPK